MEADLVSHGGESAAGSFVNTLTLTDVASGWTECVALVVRDGALVVAALESVRTSMPFPLRSVDTDNGGEFMNETVAAYLSEHGISSTRSRPYRKNDQAWVEQKNGAVVRRLVGYRRLEGLAAAEALSRLYAVGAHQEPDFSERTPLGEGLNHHPRRRRVDGIFAAVSCPTEVGQRKPQPFERPGFSVVAR